MGNGKPRGINAARKLRTVRRENRWANKSYKKAHLGTQFKCNPFGGSSHCKGIVLEKMCALPRARLFDTCAAQSLLSAVHKRQPQLPLHCWHAPDRARPSRVFAAALRRSSPTLPFASACAPS